MASSLKAKNYGANRVEADMSRQGLQAWEWVEQKFSGRREAVDVALYSIQGLPNNCKKKA